MSRIDPLDTFGILDGDEVGEVDSDGFAVTAHEDTFQGLILERIDLLVWDVGRHVDEIAGTSLGGELEAVTPSHAGLALDHVDDALEVAVVMGAGFGIGVDGDSACPQRLRSDTGAVDSRRTIHPRRLSCVAVQVVTRNDPHPARAPGVGRLVAG